MLELEQALARILSVIPPARTETISLAQSHERITAERIFSRVDLPTFDNSSMDGYAVRVADLKNCHNDKPIRLHVIGKIAAGSTFAGEVRSGQCVRVFTGSPLPGGADAVVMQEDTRTDSDQPETVLFHEPVKPLENIRICGEDVKRGDVLVDAGCKLSAGQISLIGAAGITEIKVGIRPTVGLMATGSELAEAPQTLAPGKIFESNRTALIALAGRAGAKPKIFPLVPDSLAATRAALEKSFAECDVLVTSGGVSVGEMDFVKAAFESLGGKLEFWKVAIRPGKPFVFGCWRGKFLFGLPGNPVSAFITFLLLVRPAILCWQGATDVMLNSHPAVLGEVISNPGSRRHFIRVAMTKDGRAFLAGAQGSHQLGSLARANGLIDVSPQSTLLAETTVQVLRFD